MSRAVGRSSLAGVDGRLVVGFQVWPPAAQWSVPGQAADVA